MQVFWYDLPAGGEAKTEVDLLTQARLKSLLHYDPETGTFTWLPGTGGKGRPFKSRPAGGPGNEGYWRIWIDGRFYAASHVAWLFMTGVLPAGQIDHINRQPSDNRLANLRLATQTQNKANSGAYKNNKLGIKGVRRHRNGTFEARIRVNRDLKYLGCYRTIEEAKAVYDRAASDYFGEFARTA